MEIGKIKGILEASSITNDCPMLVGVAGIGKTSVVKQFAKEKGYHCEIMISSLMEPSDLQGMPYIEHNSTKFAEPYFITRMKDNAKNGIRSILFLDEINRAPKDLLGAMLTLILEREVNGHKLPEVDGLPTIVVAGMNPDDEGDYHVDALDDAMRNRFLIVRVESDAQSWLKYAREAKVNQVVRDYIAENPTKLFFRAQDQSEMAFASPRSWEMLGKYVDNFKNIDPEYHFEIIKGKIGSALGSQFYNFFLNYVNVVKVEDIEKFIKKFKTIDESNIQSIADELYEDKLNNIESVTQMELVHQMADKYFKKADKREDVLPLLVTLYGLKIETLASVLKDYKATRNPDYKRLAVWDFNKELFRKITDKI